MSQSPNRSITPYWMGLLGLRLFRLGNHPSLHNEPLKKWLSCLVSPVWRVSGLGTEKVTACSDGVKKEKKWTSFESLFRLCRLSMIPKAIESRHNVKTEVEIGRRVSDFWLSDDERRSFFPLVQTKTPGSRKKDHYHAKRHSKPWHCTFKTHKTRSLNTIAIAETQDLRFLNLKDFSILKVRGTLE